MNLRELLDIARKELNSMSSLKNPDFRLEQAEYSKEDKIWDIVVSYLIENTNPRSTPLGAIISEYKFYRIYKRLKIDENQNVIGFYIYDKE